MADPDDTEKFNDKIKSPGKPFIGGYRNKITGSVYHHAKVQTLPSPWKYNNVERFHRDAQTVEEVDKVLQTAVNAYTQVQVRFLYLPTDNDKIIYASNKYVYADDIQSNLLQAVIVIQKYCRCWLAKKELKKLRREALLRILWDEEQERLKRQEEIDWLNELEKRKKNPRTKDDFTLLFSELQNWWKEQINQLSNEKSGAELKAELWMLIDKEVEKIEAIEKKRENVHNFKHLQGRYKVLSKAALPKIWKTYKRPVLVETSNTQKARSLYDLYTTLTIPKMTKDDRISALMEMKEIVKSFNTPLTKTLISLANREIDLMLRNTKETNLSGLRNRIRDSFWQFIRQPVYNPEMQAFNKLHTVDGAPPHIIVCSACNQYYILPSDSLDEAIGCSVLEQRFMKCKTCLYLENEGWIRKNLEHYKRILKLLRQEEEKKNEASGIIYLLQPQDILYMVEKIWKCQSCLSGFVPLKDLEFVRWNLKKCWTPWNCILLTRKEAALHNHVEDNKKFHDEDFVKEIFLKHIAARSHFSSIPRFLPYVSKQFTTSDYNVALNDVNEKSIL